MCMLKGHSVLEEKMYLVPRCCGEACGALVYIYVQEKFGNIYA